MENQSKYNSLIYLSLFGVVTTIILNIPNGFYILYPFMILGTWFHEFSHGMTALLLGGNFHQLVIFPDGSGYAQFSYSSLLFGNIGNALVAAAGPLGPTIAGNLLMLSSTNQRATKIMFYVLGLTMLISSIVWVRPIISFGFAFTIIFALIFLFIAIKSNEKVQRLTLQFVAVQAFMSLYLSIGYLFSTGAVVGGEHNMSDTQVIADNLFLPNWLWAILIIAVSIYSIIKSILITIKKEKFTSTPNRIQ
ncbi:MAG TPA: M50 family metallopeptidase [Candidatus Kapabacteria bacterium]|nr:M50 family metallopeptidase [Candidatus Kapabacteria bacterium]